MCKGNLFYPGSVSQNGTKWRTTKLKSSCVFFVSTTDTKLALIPLHNQKGLCASSTDGKTTPLCLYTVSCQ